MGSASSSGGHSVREGDTCVDKLENESEGNSDAEENDCNVSVAEKEADVKVTKRPDSGKQSSDLENEAKLGSTLKMGTKTKNRSRPSSSSSRPNSSPLTASQRKPPLGDIKWKSFDANNTELTVEQSVKQEETFFSVNESKDYEERIHQLEQQLNASESSNLDLEERVSSLQEVLDQLYTEQAKDSMAQTVDAKDAIIRNLQMDLETSQKESLRQKQILKRKVKQAKMELTEAKHESSLQIFELKSEVGQLTEEMKHLREQLDEMNQPIDCNRPSTAALRPMTAGGEQTYKEIILSLSSRVSDQDDLIIDLRNQILEKDEFIRERLGGTQVQNSRNSLNHRSKNYKVSLPSSGAEKNTASSSGQPDMNSHDHEEDMSEMRSIAKEMAELRKDKRSRRRQVKTEGEETTTSHVDSLSKEPSVDRTNGVNYEQSSIKLNHPKARERRRQNSSSASNDQTTSESYLDPSSLRRVSASKTRRKPADILSIG